eukprot:TRINITY_DN51402_c0_g1_i1.p1 TRINITY_DN51402_c0_g1~~TRINITY_DN51402_c0_g1_i1.p1  ORF type:complete len:248 (+),score=93.86 TRINITY_DN51402_c0_g1_i1:94-744(+)
MPAASPTADSGGSDEPKGKDGLPEELPECTVRVALNDCRAIRHALDDYLEEVLTGEDYGYKVDHWVSNLKILLGGSAVLIAVGSHFFPMPFPENRWFLFGCAAAYFVLSSLMQGLISYVERDVVFMSQPSETGQRLRVQTQMNSFSTEYKIIAELVPAVSGFIAGHLMAFWSRDVRGAGAATWSVGRFFDDRGVMYNPGLEKMVAEVMASVKAKRE